MTTLTHLFKRQDEEFEEKIKNILYVGFGAFGIAVSMNNGNISDGAISIRDKTIKDVEKLFSKNTQSKLEVVKAVMEMCEEEKGKWVNGEFHTNIAGGAISALRAFKDKLQSELNEIEKKI